MTSPDIWIVIATILIAFISIILNPLVFKHNLHKKRSIARDLYMALAATDFISSVYLTTLSSMSILAPKEELCVEYFNKTFCQTEYYRYQRPATVEEKVHSSVGHFFAFLPHTITAVLSISRWYQVTYPLRRLSRNAVKIVQITLGVFLAVYIPTVMFNDSPGDPKLMAIYRQTVTSWNKSNLYQRYILPSIVFLLTATATIASVLSVRKIFKSRDVAGDDLVRVRRLKSALKIVLLNVGNILNIALSMGLLLTNPGSFANMVLYSLITCFPIVQSSYNPIVYSILTTGVFGSCKV